MDLKFRRNMNLRFRRNLPLLLLFIAIVAILVLGFGNQPIIAYTIEDSGLKTEVNTMGQDSLLDEIELTSGLSAAINDVNNTPDTDPATILEK